MKKYHFPIYWMNIRVSIGIELGNCNVYMNKFRQIPLNLIIER